MSDFIQSPSITTLQSIRINPNLESELLACEKKIIIVVPCSMRHYQLGTIHQLIAKLEAVSFLHEIVVILNGDGAQTEQEKKELFDAIHTRPQLIRVLGTSESGKGRALKVGFEYVYRQYRNDAVVVTLDADFQSFSLDFLCKLIYPIVVFGGHFNKGYYVRYSNHKLDGRLTRLLVFPLLHALHAQDPEQGWLHWLLAFRYPLSGEVAMSSQLVPQLALTEDWSYDLSLMRSVYDAPEQLDVYQTELTDNYEHLHRSVDKEGDSGLMQVSRDIVQYLLASSAHNRTHLAADYAQNATQYSEKYRKLARFNGLTYPQAAEIDLIKRICNQIESSG